MNVKSWSRVRNIVKRLKVAIDLIVARLAEDFSEDVLEDFEAMGVIRQTELTGTRRKD